MISIFLISPVPITETQMRLQAIEELYSDPPTTEWTQRFRKAGRFTSHKQCEEFIAEHGTKPKHGELVCKHDWRKLGGGKLRW